VRLARRERREEKKVGISVSIPDKSRLVDDALEGAVAMMPEMPTDFFIMNDVDGWPLSAGVNDFSGIGDGVGGNGGFEGSDPEGGDFSFMYTSGSYGDDTDDEMLVDAAAMHAATATTAATGTPARLGDIRITATATDATTAAIATGCRPAAAVTFDDESRDANKDAECGISSAELSSTQLDEAKTNLSLNLHIPDVSDGTLEASSPPRGWVIARTAAAAESTSADVSASASSSVLVVQRSAVSMPGRLGGGKTINNRLALDPTSRSSPLRSASFSGVPRVKLLPAIRGAPPPARRLHAMLDEDQTTCGGVEFVALKPRGFGGERHSSGTSISTAFTAAMFMTGLATSSRRATTAATAAAKAKDAMMTRLHGERSSRERGGGGLGVAVAQQGRLALTDQDLGGSDRKFTSAASARVASPIRGVGVRGATPLFNAALFVAALKSEAPTSNIVQRSQRPVLGVQFDLMPQPTMALPMTGPSAPGDLANSTPLLLRQGSHEHSLPVLSPAGKRSRRLSAPRLSQPGSGQILV
jgi:hypothetical protein